MSSTTQVIWRGWHIPGFGLISVCVLAFMTLLVTKAIRPSPPQISGGVQLASIAEEKNRAKQSPSSALLVVQYRSDMTPAFCWVRQPIRMAMGFSSEALQFYPQEFADGYLIVNSFVSAAVLNDLANRPNDLGAAAQLLGIQLSRCLGGKYNASAPK